MRNKFINTLIEEAKINEKIFLITADLGFSVLEKFQELFPDRFLNAGIAEQNAVGIAAGLAMSGMIPYVYSIIPFVTSRCHEQVKVDCAYMNTNVRLVGVGAGLSYGSAGATHHAIEDIAIMRALPNMSIFAPGCINEAEYIARYSAAHEGPMYIRLAKTGEPEYNFDITFGKFSTIFDGSDFVIIATSNMLEDAHKICEQYQKENKNPALYSAHTLKPFDKEKMIEIINNGKPIITMEEHNIIGGLASAVSEVIAVSGRGIKFFPIAIQDEYSHYVGGQQFIKSKMGLASCKIRIDEFLADI